MTRLAKVVWGTAGNVISASASLDFGILASARWCCAYGGTAEEVEMLAMPLGGLTAVSCAFSVVAQSAKAFSLVMQEIGGRGRLGGARDDLNEASVFFVS